jgi:hypothetical protein
MARTLFFRITIRILVMLWVVTAYEAINRQPARQPSVLQPRCPVRTGHADVAAGLDRVLAVVPCGHVGLKEALDMLHRATWSNILVQWAGLSEDGIGPDTPVNVVLHNVTLRSALDAILLDANPSLQFGTEPGGLIVVTTRTLGVPRSLEVYDIRRIAPAPPPGWHGSQAISPTAAWNAGTPPVPDNQVEFASTINGFLEDDFTDGGPQDIHGLWAWGGRLVVWETSENQRRVRLMMSKLSGAAQDPNAPEPADRDLEAALDRTLREIHLQAMTLEQAIDRLRQSARINVVVNWRALHQAGIEPGTPVDLHLWNASTRQAITELITRAQQFDPDLSLKVEGNVLTITSCRFDPRSGVIRVHQVSDIIDAWITRQRAEHGPPALVNGETAEDARRHETFNAERDIAIAVADSSGPSIWKDPYSQIQCWSGRLLVNQSPAVQRRIAEFLAKLRASPAPDKSAVADPTPENQKSAPAPNAPCAGR